MANGKLKKAEKVEVVTILKKSNLLNSVFGSSFCSKNFKKLKLTLKYQILAKVSIPSKRLFIYVCEDEDEDEGEA